MNLINYINNRAIVSKQLSNMSIEFTIEKFSVSNEYAFTDENDDSAPPLASSLNGDILLIANECGDLMLFDKHKLSPLKNWRAHNNAIFDVKWRRNSDTELITASGDQSIMLWDINVIKHPVYHFERAHKGSIKSIDFKDDNVFGSGARDGVINIWDLRCPKGGSVLIIEDAHLRRLPSLRPSPKSRRSIQRSSPSNSVTCVVFHPLTQQLYSSGANDATVKIWDLRKCRRYANTINGHSTPVKQLYYSEDKNYIPVHGFTCLTFSHDYQLFANCSDHSVYRYDNDKIYASVIYKGHKVNNYVRIKQFTNDFLVSGSVDGNAYLWPIQEKKNKINNDDMQMIWPLYVFPHYDEVTAIECDNNWFSIYTSCDDQRIRKWSLLSKSDSYRPEKYQRENTQLLSIRKPKRLLSSTPVNEPLTSITNWLSTKRNEQTPHDENAKRMRLSHNSGHFKTAKENRDKSSKRKLFDDNRKITDYLSPLRLNQTI